MINLDETNLRKLNFQQVKILVHWAEKEGWNPGPYDADVFYKTDPDGFYGMFLNDEMIAGGAIISYNNAFGFMGLFIVKPKFRSFGLGRKLWYLRRDRLIERLNKNAAIGMDGVIEMQPFYKRGGFELAFKDERYERTGSKFITDANIRPIEEDDFNRISEFDALAFGFDRTGFLKNWLTIPEAKTFKFTNNEAINGYCVMRPAGEGFKIGPLFANDDLIAEELYKTCLNSAIGKSVYFDIPMVNKGAVNIVKKYDAKYVFECARMYYGSPPKMDMTKVYGITSFELG